MGRNCIGIKDENGKQIDCTKRASFGLPDDDKATKCSIHKITGMLNLTGPKCGKNIVKNDKGEDIEIFCGTCPVFGEEGEKPSKCAKHKTITMTNIKDIKRQCIFTSTINGKTEKCKIKGNFGKIGEKPTHCSVHKQEGEKDLYHKECGVDGCEIQPCYNFITEKTGLRCQDHMDDGMVDVKNKPIICIDENCKSRAIYNDDGEKKPIYCLQHSKILKNPYDVLNKLCEGKTNNVKCKKHPSYNHKGLPAKFCFDHKELTMRNVNAIQCLGDKDCSVQPSFNNEGLSPLYCFIHKTDTMINLHNGKECEIKDCKSRANYNYDGERPIVCFSHQKEGMININSKKCIHIDEKGKKCLTFPTQNFIGEKQGIYCAKHKKKGMTDIINKKCQCDTEECNKIPSFNTKGEKVGKFCVKHKEEGMIDVRSKKCLSPNCDIMPTFNFKGEKPLVCEEHMEEGMINVKNKNICDGDNGNCGKIATYGLKEDMFKIKCLTHKTEEMISIGNKECKGGDNKNCKKTPNYNFKGETTGIRCVSHKDKGMIDVSHQFCIETNCESRARFGQLFEAITHCATHRKPNQHLNNNPICDGIWYWEDDSQPEYKCKNKAIYVEEGQSYPIHCEGHKKDNEILLCQKYCISCNLPDFIASNKNMCSDCETGDKIKTREKSRELNIKKLLEKNNIEIESYDKIIDSNVSRQRPDFVINHNLFKIIIEVDENQHSSYLSQCEVQRMVAIHNSFCGKNVVFVRFNPDKYTDIKKNKITGGKKDVENKLIEYIQGLMNRKTNVEHPLSVSFIAYDGYDSKNIVLKNIDYDRDDGKLLMKRIEEIGLEIYGR